MSLALAVAAATGLNPERDFEVRDNGDGRGPFLANWRSDTIPTPDSAQLAQWQADWEAGAKAREKDRVLRARALEYVVGLMYQQELADAGKLTALRADIATEIAKVEVQTIDPIEADKP